MNIFRSEDHIHRWLAGRPAGASITIDELSALAHAWWSDRVDPEWKPHTRAKNQDILDRLGLTGDFWRLP
jgi:hypothetical protein